MCKTSALLGKVSTTAFRSTTDTNSSASNGYHRLLTNNFQRAFTAICLHISYVFAVPMKEMSAKNVVQTYPSGILAHKSGGVAILSDNGTEYKNKLLNQVCDQLGIKRIFSNPFHP